MVERSAFGLGLGPMAALCAVWCGSAQADPLTAEEILQGYNLVTNGNALTTSDIEGSAVIGGNFTGATIFNNTHSSNAASLQSFTVFGALANTNSLNIDDLGVSHPVPTLFYNGPTNPPTSGAPPVSYNGRATKAPIPSGTSISDYTTPLNQLESALAGESSNNTANTADMNKFMFDATTYNAQGLAVFDITAAELETAGGISVLRLRAGRDRLSSTSPASAETCCSRGILFGPVERCTADQVIWNFEAPTTPGSYTITTQADWYGAMLAGDYNVVNPSDIDGFLYADTFNGGASNGAELHYYGFDGAAAVVGP